GVFAHAGGGEDRHQARRRSRDESDGRAPGLQGRDRDFGAVRGTGTGPEWGDDWRGQDRGADQAQSAGRNRTGYSARGQGGGKGSGERGDGGGEHGYGAQESLAAAALSAGGMGWSS